MIKSIYKDYFQKSFTFLYPLLGFKKVKHPRPTHTFMYWPEKDVSKFYLYCVYKKEDNEKWKLFEKNNLLPHRCFVECEMLKDNSIAYVFDLTEFKEDYECLTNGTYSKFSRKAKEKISDYYGVHTPEWVYIESFLFPSKYYSIYAEILDVDEKILKDVGELCPKYDPEKEMFDKESYNLMLTK